MMWTRTRFVGETREPVQRISSINIGREGQTLPHRCAIFAVASHCREDGVVQAGKG